jgi:predicted RNA-binding protein with PIN domain
VSDVAPPAPGTMPPPAEPGPWDPVAEASRSAGPAAAEPDPAGRAPGGPPATDRAAAAAPPPLAEVPEPLVAGYLDAALEALRAADPADLPGALRQYQAWTPRRLRHPRVLGLVRRTLDLDQSFRAVVDDRVLDEEAALARLLRAGRHAEALASGETPEAVARVGLALGAGGAAAVQAAVEAAATSRARAEAEAARSALAGAASELDAARARADTEAAAARAAREELRAAREELRRAERQVRAQADRADGLDRELAKAEATLRQARADAADEQRRLSGRLAETQGRLAETQRRYRALRRASRQVDPALAEAVGALERDLQALRRAAGLADEATEVAGAARHPERRSPLPVPAGRAADDPETLAAWMATPGLLLLVDGYNVTKHERGFPDRALEDQRTLLLDLCRRLARRSGAEVTVVFDGGTVGPVPTRLPLGPVEVVFTDAGRTADDEIVARANAAPPERPVVVVTSDNELRERVAALGASTTRSPALLGLAAPR